MELTFLILGFIMGLLLGIIIEKRKYHKKNAKLFCEVMKEISNIKKENKNKI